MHHVCCISPFSTSSVLSEAVSLAFSVQINNILIKHADKLLMHFYEREFCHEDIISDWKILLL